MTRVASRRGIVWAFNALIFLSMGVTAFADGSGGFSLDWATELTVGVPAGGVYAWGEYAAADEDGGKRPFGWFDDNWTVPYDSNLDQAADITRAAGIAALPFLLDRLSVKDAATIAVMYTECTLLCDGTRNVIKAAVRRPRPYLSYDDTPRDVAESGSRYHSFPSGHTATAFMNASFASYVFSRGDSSTERKWMMGGLTFAIAGVTGALRVAAGVHHVTDVAAGAAIGTAAGILVPWLHETFQGGARLRIGLDRIVMEISY